MDQSPKGPLQIVSKSGPFTPKHVTKMVELRVDESATQRHIEIALTSSVLYFLLLVCHFLLWL